MAKPKKKSANKAKKTAAKKSTPRKQTAKNIAKIKKSANAKPVIKTTSTANPSGEKKNNTIKLTRGMKALEAAVNGMDLDITFKLGLGEIAATHFRDGTKIDKKKVLKSGSIHFENVQATDVISINGACSGSCTLITNRQTDPLSDSNQPRSYASGSIFDNLVVEQ